MTPTPDDSVQFDYFQLPGWPTLREERCELQREPSILTKEDRERERGGRGRGGGGRDCGRERKRERGRERDGGRERDTSIVEESTDRRSLSANQREKVLLVVKNEGLLHLCSKLFNFLEILFPVGHFICFSLKARKSKQEHISTKQIANRQ